MSACSQVNTSICKVANRHVAGPAGELALGIYTPLSSNSAILSRSGVLSGGGFVICDYLCRALVDAATKWISDNTGELGIDPNRLTVGGDSGDRKQ